ncbi:carboxyl-terminal processing protease [Peptostreptococcaceae bacterium pGA-8]|nr:carboxyl-terminal processing protease [Peptostreptococcaceae bacterium pGA-8]
MIQINKKKFISSIVLAAIIGGIVVGGGIMAALSLKGLSLVSAKEAKEMKGILDVFGKFPAIQETVEGKGIFKIDKAKAQDDVYKAYVNALGDKYSEYLNAEEAKEWEESLSGEFSGVGVNFREEDGVFVVIKTIEGSPASKEDIKAGDIIEKVDGKTYSEHIEMAKAIRGEEGSKVTLTLSRDGESKDITMVRGTVKEKTVTAAILDDNIGYIRILSFEEGTAKEFKEAVSQLESKGVEKAVIDIRENFGGYTKEGIDIADMLLPEGTITYMKDKKGKKEYFNSDVNRTKLKYSLLVNENTASTSEILAAAVKDNKGGPVVGTKTFGKGIVQNTYKFNDGSALKLTIMQYFSPKGKTIHKKGVKPDYVVELPENAESDVQLAKAVELLK